VGQEDVMTRALGFGSAQQVPLLKSPLWNCVCCSVLQCVAVCCRVLQCVAVCCGVLQTTSQRSALELFLRVTQTHFKDRGAVCCSVLQCATVAQCVAVCYIVLQCVAVCCSVQVNLLYPLDTELTFFSV